MGEALADDHAQRRKVIAVLGERVGGNLPAALSQRTRDVEDGEVWRTSSRSLKANTGSSSPLVISSNGSMSAIRPESRVATSRA